LLSFDSRADVGGDKADEIIVNEKTGEVLRFAARWHEWVVESPVGIN